MVIVFASRRFDGLVKTMCPCPFSMVKTGILVSVDWIAAVFFEKKVEELILFKNPSKYLDTG